MEYDFRRKATPVLIGLLLLLTTTFAFGQGISTGSITGVVQDQQQAVVSGAKVTAQNIETNQESSSESNSVGSFALRSLPVGTYAVTIEAPKFQKLRIRSVIVTSGRDTALGVKTLTIGAEEVVNVESTPPLVETQSSQVATSFDSRKTTDLPFVGGLNGGADNLALLIPGMASTGDQGFSNTNGPGLSSNGQRGRSNNFQIDGQSNNDNSVAGPSLFLGNQDVLAEFQVVSNNFSAEYGRNMGSVVNYVTKSGSNSYHGSAFWFHTNGYTDSLANDDKTPLLGFCESGQDPALTGCTPVEVPHYVENRQGGTFGGPIFKDKAWFFLSAHNNQIKNRTPFTSTGFTPTPTGLATLAATYCAGVVPSCPSHPALGALLTNGPYANPSGNPEPQQFFATLENATDGVTPVVFETAPIRRVVNTPSDSWEATGRVDIQLTSKDRFFARYIFQDLLFTGGTGRFAAGAWVDVPGRTQQIGVDWVRNWTNTFINQFRFSYSRAFFGFEGQAGGLFAGCTIANFGSCPTGISFNDNNLNFGFQSNLPQNRLVNNSQWQDNATWVKGRHTLKFGGEYARQRSPNNFLPNFNGTFLFGVFDTGMNELLQNSPFQLGLVQGTSLFNFKEQDAAFYFQDDWRVKDNLTLNLGIRWEFTQQAINLLSQLTLARESDPATAIFNPTFDISERIVPETPNDTNNWGPNIGFAWTPRFWEGFFGRDKTVVRGGYRIAYDPAFYNIFANVATAAPTVNAATFNFFPVPAGTSYSGDEVRAAYAASFTLANPRFRTRTRVSPDFHNPYTQQWSLGVQRQITPKVAAEVRYVGNHTVGNFQTINANPRINFLTANFPSIVPSGLTACPTGTSSTGLGRIDCNRRLVRERANTAWSIYHGVQSRLDFQNWHGMTAGLSYTFSRTIDNVSEIFSTFGGGTTIAGSQSLFDTNVAERGVAGISYPHVASFYAIYDLPWFKSQDSTLGRFLGGWQVNGIWNYRSGQSFNPTFFGVLPDQCDWRFAFAFFGSNTCRPIVSNTSASIDSVGICTNAALADCGLQNYFDGSAVSASDVYWIINDNTAALFFGDPYLGVPRNTFRGQSVNNTNFGVFKNTKITEKVTIQFQANAFNVLTRQFRGVPDPVIEDCPLSAAGTAGDGFCNAKPGSFMNNFFNSSNRRRLTFGLKLIF